MTSKVVVVLTLITIFLGIFYIDDSISKFFQIPRGLELPPDDLFDKDASLHSENPSGSRFMSEDINNATKYPRPSYGFPPRSLPKNHTSYRILRSLRSRTQLNPRWPDHPELHLSVLKSYGPAYASIIISKKLKVVFVPVFKVGTTSMMWNIAYLENIPEIVHANISNEYERDYVLHDFGSNVWAGHTIYNLPESEVRSSLNDPSYLKFGFVRNPYDRAISAYLDKVVKWPFWSFEYQKQMYGLYGNDESSRAYFNFTKPTFKEYLQAIEKVISSPRTSEDDLSKEDAYETNESRRDIHFRPQVELIHPDLIHLDFVGRFENMRNDTNSVLQWMYQFTERRMPDSAHRKLHTTNRRDKVSLYQLLRDDRELRSTLIRIYKSDFLHFEFSENVPEDPWSPETFLYKVD